MIDRATIESQPSVAHLPASRRIRISDTRSTAGLQDLHVQSLPARTVMTAMGAPTGMGGLNDVFDDFTDQQSIPLASSSADGSSADGADGQVGGSGKSGGDGGLIEGRSSSDISESG